MSQIILITGATDGLGLATARKLAAAGHHVLLHGRNQAKLSAAESAVRDAAPGAQVGTFVADLSRLEDVAELAGQVRAQHSHLDVLINNAGVLRTSDPVTPDGLDARFAVNTISPYLLTQTLLPLFDSTGRVVNVSSAAQAPVDPEALAGRAALPDSAAYAQSKLALTMWTNHLAASLPEGPVVVSVNPGSLLATKMVKEGFGIDGKDIGIGSDILSRAAVGDEFGDAAGKYFDNDSGRFAPPHSDALDPVKNRAVAEQIAAIVDGRPSN